MQQQIPGINRTVVTVAELNRDVRRLLEGEFPMLWVEGEVSNFIRPSSGHWYFTLKDQRAQIRCAMFKNRNYMQRFTPRDGLQVVIRGRLSLYEGRGEYQLIAEHIEEAGDGALRRAFDALKTKLQGEGLFDESAKKPIPTLPQHLGIITSPSGAAIHDILQVLDRRFPAIRASILPVQVQGQESVRQIVRRLEFANRYEADPFDLVLLARGGGSLEDLISFNAEPVARAIAASRIPVVCAVGHESDVSIADFVADLRAPTPSAAAELISPDYRDWLSITEKQSQRLASGIRGQIANRHSTIQHLSRRLRHPGRRLQDLHQRLDGLELRLTQSLRTRLGEGNPAQLANRLKTGMALAMERKTAALRLLNRSIVNPSVLLQQHAQTLETHRTRMTGTMTRQLGNHSARFGSVTAKLNALSPLSTLERGYAIVTDDEGQVVTQSGDLAVRQTIAVQLQEGRIKAEVTETDD